MAPAAEAGWTRSAGTSSKFSCELDEQLDLARTDMTRMTEKQDLIIRRQDVMIEKQEGETITVIKKKARRREKH